VQAGRQQNQRDQQSIRRERSSLGHRQSAGDPGYGQGYVPGVEIRAKKKREFSGMPTAAVNAVSNGIIVHRDL